jgi:hypothetical protein
MNDADFAPLERQLAQRLPVDPPPELRARVARTVARELGRQSIEWFSVAGVAAAALVLLANLSWTAGRDATSFEPPRASDAAIAAQIRDLLPHLSDAEVRWQAAMLKRAARLPDGNAARRAAELGVTR